MGRRSTWLPNGGLRPQASSIRRGSARRTSSKVRMPAANSARALTTPAKPSAAADGTPVSANVQERALHVTHVPILSSWVSGRVVCSHALAASDCSLWDGRALARQPKQMPSLGHRLPCPYICWPCRVAVQLVRKRSRMPSVPPPGKRPRIRPRVGCTRDARVRVKRGAVAYI